jgi:hypothetical protein
MRKRLTLSAAVLLVALAPQAQPFAQGMTQPTVPVPLQDLPASWSFGERIGRWFGSLRDSVGLGPSATDLASRYSNDSLQSEDFNWLMGIAGFKLKTIESTISLLPGLSLEFGQSRELSEADREYLERALDRHSRRHPGPLAAIQRMIVEGILEANEIQGFSVETITVTLLPLPYVKFTLSPTDPPLGREASRILRSIEQLNRRLQQSAGPRTGGNQLDVPPPPMLRRAGSSI